MILISLIMSLWTALAWAEHTPTFDTCEQAAAAVEAAVTRAENRIATKQPNPTPEQRADRPTQLNDARCSTEEVAYAHVREEHPGTLCRRTSTALGITCPR
jgi:hypothetical protein